MPQPGEEYIINTEAEVTVSRILKPPVASELAVGSTLVIREHGGQVGKLKHIVPKEPMVAQGEEYLLFLHRLPTERELYRPWASTIGKFKVVNSRIFPMNNTDRVAGPQLGKEVQQFTREILEEVAR